MSNFIMSLFEGSLAQITFFSIFCAGLVFTLFSLLFGGDADHSDVDFEHGEHGGFDADHGDIDHDHGTGHGGDFDHDDASASHGPSLFSVRGVSIMAVGFGGTAYLVQMYTGKVLLSSVAGLMSGWAFAFGCMALINIFLKQQASSNVRATDIRHAQGWISTSIPKGGAGEVVLSVSGSQRSKRAVSVGGGAISRGTRVRVCHYSGTTVVVEAID